MENDYPLGEPIGKKSIINSLLKLFKREGDCVGLKHETTIGPFNGSFNALMENDYPLGEPIGKKSIINSLLKLFKREGDCVGLKHETTIGPFNGSFNAAVVGTK